MYLQTNISKVSNFYQPITYYKNDFSFALLITENVLAAMPVRRLVKVNILFPIGVNRTCVKQVEKGTPCIKFGMLNKGIMRGFVYGVDSEEITTRGAADR